MQLQRLLVILGIVLSLSLLICCQSTGKVTFQDAVSQQTEKQGNISENSEEIPTQQRTFNPVRHVEDLFDYIGFGTGRNVDPYLAKINERCVTGDLAECFKSRALYYFSDLFDHTEYSLNDNVRVKRMSDSVVTEVYSQPYEYSNEPRTDETEWDKMLNFMKRKVERFVKTMTFELTIPTSESDRDAAYEPRFLSDIFNEVNILEDKKDTLFFRHQFRKFLIPMLFVLKLFKLKLLLFLPLIFGLVSFKKFLGLLAIAIPGIIGFIKFYKPSNYFQPVYTTNGIGYPHYGESNIGYHEDHYTESYGQDLAYKGYQHYKS